MQFWFAAQPWVVVSDPEIARKLALRFNTRPGFDALNVLPHSELVLQQKGLFVTTDMTLWGIARRAFDTSLLPPARCVDEIPLRMAPQVNSPLRSPYLLTAHVLPHDSLLTGRLSTLCAVSKAVNGYGDFDGLLT